MLQFNLLIVGNQGVGKTTYINRHITGEFTRDYVHTPGILVKCLSFWTDQGQVTFTCYDCGEFFDPHARIHAAIIMFDVTSKSSYNNVGQWYLDVINQHGEIPIILCGNKVDVKDRVVKSKQITFHRKHNLIYCDISAKCNYNFEKPFLTLCRKLMNNTNLTFVEMPAIEPPTVNIEQLRESGLVENVELL